MECCSARHRDYCASGRGEEKAPDNAGAFRIQVATRSVLSAPHTVLNEFLHAARARTGATGIAALSGELLAPLDLSLERRLTHEASLAFLTTNRH
jgi:hypothetical protein